MGRYFDMFGQPMELMEWAHAIENTEQRVIGNEERDGVTVSTVWLGLDHSFGAELPLIFETMIFGGAHDQYQERYPNREMAEEGHARAVTLAFG